MKILQLTTHFSPNVGGVETHLDDLVAALIRRKHAVTVLTYRPLTTKTAWNMREQSGELLIYRIPWIAGLFYRFIKHPALEFIYLVPGLFFVLPFFLLKNRPEVIHTHGLIAGFVGVLWGKVFRIRTVTTTHSMYHFPSSGIYRRVSIWIFSQSDHVLTLSQQSAKEIRKLGVAHNRITVFRYWVQKSAFKQKSKQKRGTVFSVLFVGRLVEEKGVRVLLDAAKSWKDKDVELVIVGSGPLEDLVLKTAKANNHIRYIGRVKNTEIATYYHSASVVVVPSTHEEGFGRVIIESLTVGTPVIAANRGAIPEAMDDSVGMLISVTPKNITKAVMSLATNPEKQKSLAYNAKAFAQARYSEKNVETIIKTYTKET